MTKVKTTKRARTETVNVTSAAEKLASLKAQIAALKSEAGAETKAARDAERDKREKAARPIAEKTLLALRKAHDDETILACIDVMRRELRPQREGGARGGAKAQILGRSAISVMRALGAASYTRAEAKAVVAALCDGGADALAEASYATSMSHGRTYDSSRPVDQSNRAPAELTKDEWAQIDVACGRSAATTTKAKRKSA